jgi:hypothetical protein
LLDGLGFTTVAVEISALIRYAPLLVFIHFTFANLMEMLDVVEEAFVFSSNSISTLPENMNATNNSISLLAG